MFFPIFFPVSAGGGKPKLPTTRGPIILGVVAALIFGGTGAVGLLAFGLSGLLAIPMLALLLLWCFGWCWLATQCMDHSINTEGVVAGIYTGAGLLAIGIALGSFAGALTGIVASTIR